MWSYNLEGTTNDFLVHFFQESFLQINIYLQNVVGSHLSICTTRFSTPRAGTLFFVLFLWWYFPLPINPKVYRVLFLYFVGLCYCSSNTWMNETLPLQFSVIPLISKIGDWLLSCYGILLRNQKCMCLFTYTTIIKAENAPPTLVGIQPQYSQNCTRNWRWQPW